MEDGIGILLFLFLSVLCLALFIRFWKFFVLLFISLIGVSYFWESDRNIHETTEVAQTKEERTGERSDESIAPTASHLAPVRSNEATDYWSNLDRRRELDAVVGGELTREPGPPLTVDAKGNPLCGSRQEIAEHMLHQQQRFDAGGAVIIAVNNNLPTFRSGLLDAESI
ncbi:MAG: hypothetical protein OXC69_08575 [Candidatus Tectomicrobia bacterium]|nr:hypothetical protein [Candidatus Tectomicrobia bacterium]